MPKDVESSLLLDECLSHVVCSRTSPCQSIFSRVFLVFLSHAHIHGVPISEFGVSVLHLWTFYLELPPHILYMNCTVTFMCLLKSYFSSAILTLFFIFIICDSCIVRSARFRRDTKLFCHVMLCISTAYAVMQCLAGWMIGCHICILCRNRNGERYGMACCGVGIGNRRPTQAC